MRCGPGHCMESGGGNFPGVSPGQGGSSSPRTTIALFINKCSAGILKSHFFSPPIEYLFLLLGWCLLGLGFFVWFLFFNFITFAIQILTD